MHDSPLLIGFGFGNVAMLGWLAAAAAPFLIHLWSRRRFREAPWAAMQFLLAAVRKNSRRLQLQQWLLLVVRTLIVVLVVLAVAEPYGERQLMGGTAEPVHRIIVIDVSYSMSYRGDEGSAFVRAKQLAAQSVRSSGPGDIFTVIEMGQKARVLVGPEVIDHAAVAREIELLTESHSGANLASAISLIRRSLSTGRSSHKLPGPKEIVFFTDLQRGTWASLSTIAVAGEDASSSAVSGDLALLARQAPVVIFDLGRSEAANLVVMNISMPDTFVTPGREVTFDITLHQFGAERRANARVEFLVDGVRVGEQKVDVPSGGDAAIHFNHRFPSAGNHAVSVRALGDSLNVDNSRWLVVPVRQEVVVLCVAGRTNATKYIASALSSDPSGASAIRPVEISDGDFADITLADYDCVFLCNVAQFTSSEAERLNRYVSAGGGVVVFLGDRIDVENYNSQAKPEMLPNAPNERRPPLIPAHIGELIASSQFGLDPLDYRHPIVAPFRGRERAGLLTTPVARYYRLDVSRYRPNAEVVAALSGGDPFIVSASRGRGRVVLVATDGSLSSVDPQSGEPWTSWPTWPSFLPVVRELLSYAGGGRNGAGQLRVGDSLDGGEGGDVDLTRLHISRPDGRNVSVSTIVSAAGREWTYSDTSLPGIYTLNGLPASKSRQFAINVDTTEGDLTKADAAQLPTEISVRNNWRDESNRRGADVISPSSWNQLLLWCTLVLLLTESLLCWRFGRGAT